jgi:hypothetical protein
MQYVTSSKIISVALSTSLTLSQALPSVIGRGTS